ncbi:MAG: hypothetical protein IJU41_07075, partial [Clostridia bacterium]|nr:hypothetical protein [Clostridia bacterium]
MLNFQVHTEEYRRERTPYFTDVWSVEKVVTDADGWELPPKMQNHALLLYVESGGLCFSKDGALFSLGKGETLLCAAGVRLGLKGEGACFYLVRFDCSDLHFFI